jgi:hypothetical protein
MQTLIIDNCRTAIPATPPANWEREIPRYRVVHDVHRAPKERFKFESPFSNILDSTEWQYAERDYRAGQAIETTDWPHPSFFPLNYGARKVSPASRSRACSDRRGQPVRFASTMD